MPIDPALMASLETVRKVIDKFTDEKSGIFKHGAAIACMTVGVVEIGYAMAIKLLPWGSSELASSSSILLSFDFSALVISGAVLMVVGAGLKTYQYKIELEMINTATKSNASMVNAITSKSGVSP